MIKSDIFVNIEFVLIHDNEKIIYKSRLTVNDFNILSLDLMFFITPI